MRRNAADVLNFQDSTDKEKALWEAGLIIEASHRYVRFGEVESLPEIHAAMWCEIRKGEAWQNEHSRSGDPLTTDELKSSAARWRQIRQWSQDLVIGAAPSADGPSGPEIAAAAGERLTDDINQLLYLARRGYIESSLSHEFTQMVDGLAGIAARGDEFAFSRLLDVAEAAVKALRVASDKQPELARKLAEPRPDWPSLIGPHPDRENDNSDLVEKLNLGDRSPKRVKASGKKGRVTSDRLSPGQPFQAVIGTCIERLVSVLRPDGSVIYDYPLEQLRVHAEKECREQFPAWVIAKIDLPDIAEIHRPDIRGKWFDAMWLLLMEATGGRPEEIPELSEVGKFREEAQQRTRETKQPLPDQRRQGLREALRKAFERRYSTPPDKPL